MVETLQWSFNTLTKSGPLLSDNGVLSIDAFDKMEIEIEKASAANAMTGIEVEVLPAPPTIDNWLLFLIIAASAYNPPKVRGADPWTSCKPSDPCNLSCACA